MTFDFKERSSYDGVPTQLYEFSLGTARWRYAAGMSDVTLNGVKYTAMAIEHDGYSSSGDPTSDEMTVRLTARAEVTDVFIGTPPSSSLLLNIRSVHRGDTEAPVVWSGVVKSGRQTSGIEFVFTCNSLLATLNRNGLRLSWGRGCPHALYDRSCRVNPSDFGIAIQISGLTGTQLISAALNSIAANHLAGGYLSFAGKFGNTEMRAIESNGGNTLEIMGSTDGIVVNSWVTVFPGCDRTTATCQTKFNNLPNYGGFPHLPTKSPFDGDPIF